MSRAQAVVGVPIALAVARGRFAKLRRVRPCPYALAEVPPDMPPILSSESYGPELTDIAAPRPIRLFCSVTAPPDSLDHSC
jgi:hypothetical protein